MGPGNSFSPSPSWYFSIQKNRKQDPRKPEVEPPIGATPPTPWAPGLTLQKFAKFATADPGEAGLLMKVLPHPQVQTPLGEEMGVMGSPPGVTLLMPWGRGLTLRKFEKNAKNWDLKILDLMEESEKKIEELLKNENS